MGDLGMRQAGMAAERDGSQENKHFVKRAQLAGKRGRQRERKKGERDTSHICETSSLLQRNDSAWQNYSNNMLLLLCTKRQTYFDVAKISLYLLLSRQVNFTSQRNIW